MVQLQATAARRLFAWGDSQCCCCCWSRPFAAGAPPLQCRSFSLGPNTGQRLVQYTCLLCTDGTNNSIVVGHCSPFRNSHYTSSCGTTNGGSCRSSCTNRSNHRSNISNRNTSSPRIAKSTSNSNNPFRENSSFCYGSIGSSQEQCFPRVSRDIRACKWLRADIQQPHKTVRVIPAVNSSSAKEASQRGAYHFPGRCRTTSSFSSLNGQPDSAGLACTGAQLPSSAAAAAKHTERHTCDVDESSITSLTVTPVEDTREQEQCGWSERPATTRAGSISAVRYEEGSTHAPTSSSKRSGVLSSTSRDCCCKNTNSSPDNRSSDMDTYVCSSVADSDRHAWLARKSTRAGGIETSSGCTRDSCGASHCSCGTTINCLSSSVSSPADHRHLTFVHGNCGGCNRTTGERQRITATGSSTSPEDQTRSETDIKGPGGKSGRRFIERSTPRSLPAVTVEPFVAGAPVEPVESSATTSAAAVITAPAVLKARAATTSLGIRLAVRTTLLPATEKGGTGSGPSALSSEVPAAATYDQPTGAGISPLAGQQQSVCEAFACSGSFTTAAAEERRGGEACFSSTAKLPENNGSTVALHADAAVASRFSVNWVQQPRPHLSTAAEKAAKGKQSSEAECNDLAAWTCRENYTVISEARSPLCSFVFSGAVGQEEKARRLAQQEVSEWEGDEEFEGDEKMGEAEDDTADGDKEGIHCWGENESRAAAGVAEHDYTTAYSRYMECMPLTVEEEEKIKRIWHRLLRDDWLCWQLRQRWGFLSVLLGHSQLQRSCLRYFKQQVQQQVLPFAVDVHAEKRVYEKRITEKTARSISFPSTERCSNTSAGSCLPSPSALSASLEAVVRRTQAEPVKRTTAAEVKGTEALQPLAAAAAEDLLTGAGGRVAVLTAGGARAAVPAEAARTVTIQAAAEATATSDAPAGREPAEDATDSRAEPAATMFSTARYIRGGGAAGQAADLRAFIREQRSVAAPQDRAEDGRRMHTLLFMLKHLRAAAAGRATALTVALAEAVRQNPRSRRRNINTCMQEYYKSSEPLSSSATCTSRAALEGRAFAFPSPSKGLPSKAGVAGVHWPAQRQSTEPETSGDAADAAACTADIQEDAAVRAMLAGKETASFTAGGEAQRPAAEDLTRSSIDKKSCYIKRGALDGESAHSRMLPSAVAAGGVCSDTYHTWRRLLPMEVYEVAKVSTCPRGCVMRLRIRGGTPVAAQKLLQLERESPAPGCADNIAVAGGVNALAAADFALSSSPVLLPPPADASGCLNPTSRASTRTTSSNLTSSSTHLAEVAPLLCLMRWYLAEQHADHVLQYLNLTRLADLRSPATWYPAARALNRDVALHAGPPNSGKTAAAVQHLMQASTGCYLAPLRLLAWEVYTELKQRSVKVSLITGQERRIHKGATHMCCTVEAAPFNSYFACGVIDEAQLVSDPQRGDSWTRALLGLPAQQLHVCCEERAVPLLQELFSQCRERCCIRRYQRLAPLNVDHKPVEDLDALCTGDCLVCFTRGDALKLRKRLCARGFDVYTIYGQLPPAVKQRQADLFNAAVRQAYLERCRATNCSTDTPGDESTFIFEKPKTATMAASAAVTMSAAATGTSAAASTDSPPAATSFSCAGVAAGASAAAEGKLLHPHRRTVLIATDAIGLGLNLHIRRIVFYRLQKYAGSGDGAARLLTEAEIRQLAGRAGRRSGVWGEKGGLVSCMEGEDFERVKRAIEGEAHAECLERAALVPSLPQLIAFCEELERQETGGETDAAGREEDSRSVFASLLAAQQAEAEQQGSTGNALAGGALRHSEPTGIRRKNSVTATTGRLRYERDTVQSSSGAAADACGSSDVAVRSVYAGSDPATAAAHRNGGSARSGAAGFAAQRSGGGASAASGEIHAAQSPTSSWHSVSLSYAEAVRYFVSLLQVDPLYFVPPHKLNLMLSIVHALADVPLPRQQLFTFCLAPLPFSSPFPFLKHTQKPKQQRREQQQQQQRIVGYQQDEHLHGQRRDTTRREENGGTVEITNDTSHAPGSQPVRVAALAARRASNLTVTPSVSAVSHTEADANDHEAIAEEGRDNRGEREAADALCLEGGYPLSAVALAGAGLSLLLLNALRTFAVLLATCGHVPLPPHVFVSASDGPAHSAAGAAAPRLHPATDLLQHREEPMEQLSSAEEHHCLHVGHRSQQQNQRRIFSEISKPAAPAVDHICWHNGSHAEAGGAGRASHIHVGAASQRASYEEVSACNNANSPRAVVNVRIIASPADAGDTEGHAATDAQDTFVSAKYTSPKQRGKICGESAEAVEAREASMTEAETQEDEKRHAERLLLLEENYQIVELYVWLARKFPAAFVDLPLALQVQRTLTEAIDAHLRTPK